jgi:FkbM family methyltransferase
MSPKMKESFIAKLYLNVYQRGDFKGRHWLLRTMESVFGKSLFIRSAYGVSIRANFRDLTWVLAQRGYRQTRVTDEVISLDPDDCFLDVGSNLGVFSLLAAGQMNAGGLVIAFEPNRMVFEDLVANFNFNDFSTPVLLICAGVSDHAGIAGMNVSEAHSGRGSIQLGSGGNLESQVLLISDLDFLAPIIGSKKVTVKIDTEGHEIRVIRAILSSIISKNVTKLIVEVDSQNLESAGGNLNSLYTLLMEHDYRPIWSDTCGHFDEVFVKNA